MVLDLVAKFVMGRVCHGPSLLWAEFVMGRDVPESFGPVLPGGHECEGPKLSFHIPRPVAPVLYKLLLSHLGDKNTNFSLRIREFC